jgi:SAM-dependent methyltransferase
MRLLGDKMEIRDNTPSDLRLDFLNEYSAEENIRRYMKKTAGHGISYLLEHDYGDIYLEVIDKYIPKAKTGKGLRLLEFGCGAGMNLLYLVSVLERRGMAVDFACGTDFSEPLVESAKVEAKEALRPQLMEKIRFCVARNENLVDDMTRQLGSSRESLVGSFDLIFGVNTIRYCHRLKNEKDCAEGIQELLSDGGVCIVIDMNDKFPAFRSRFRDRMTKEKDSYYLPMLDEYARPFVSAGFEILRKDNFCWIPHSAGQSMTTMLRFISPLLNGIGRRYAMRSLVISRKTDRQHP